MFTGGSNKKVANIKINDLAFNITTNSGESNDRVLHLQAGKLEQFDIILTNLNKVNIKSKYNIIRYSLKLYTTPIYKYFPIKFFSNIIKPVRNRYLNINALLKKYYQIH